MTNAQDSATPFDELPLLVHAYLVVLALALGSASTWIGLRPATDDHVAESVVDSHMRGLMAQQPADIASSDRHTVKPWFNSRIPQSPQVIDLGKDGFPLIGGRVDVVGG
jgi:anti-sigma factor RsiW